MLAGVSTVWDAEAKVKVEALQQVIAEVVPLDHPEIVQGSVSNCELHPVGRKTEKSGEDARLPETVAVIVCRR